MASKWIINPTATLQSWFRQGSVTFLLCRCGTLSLCGYTVVGVDLDYVELSAAGSMVMLVASGTAVVIEE